MVLTDSKMKKLVFMLSWVIYEILGFLRAKKGVPPKKIFLPKICNDSQRMKKKTFPRLKTEKLAISPHRRIRGTRVLKGAGMTILP